MTYALKWIDESRRLVTLHLSDPYSTQDTQRLGDELRTIIETPRPIFVLLNLEEFDFAKNINRLPMDGPPMGSNSPHLALSRVAIVGGGPAIGMILSLTAAFAPADMIKAFKHEDEALLWLRDQSDNLSVKFSSEESP